MRYTIISTMPKNGEDARKAIEDLTAALPAPDVIYTEGMNIHGCIGCNDCWLKTPGICSVKDDYEQIFIKILQSDRIIFIAEAKRGFVSYKAKDLLDRILPIATMHLKFEKGQMRHYNRYNKRVDMGLLFNGDGDLEFLRMWMNRVTLNFGSECFGVYEISHRKELCNALGCN